jgi:hypothetical protein
MKMSKFNVGSIVRLKKSATLNISEPDGISLLSRSDRLGVVTEADDADADGDSSCRVFTVGKVLGQHSWCYLERELKGAEDE